MNKHIKNREIKIIFLLLTVIFTVFLVFPLLVLGRQSFQNTPGGILEHYRQVFERKDFFPALLNSLFVSAVSGAVTTALAFGLAYAIHYTNLPRAYKMCIRQAAVLPMLLPTITYGFAIIYSFGKQGMITRLLGGNRFEIYGFWGLLIGYVIYTLPVSFVLIQNTMGFIDKKFTLVSRIMGDKKWDTFLITVLRPLSGTFAASFIQCFFLSFTDYGIPASVGGKYQVAATILYNEMLGSVPDFSKGAVIAIIMLVPSVVSIGLLKYLERYNIRYTKISQAEPAKNKIRDGAYGVFSFLVMAFIASVFAVIFIIPFVKGWPYDMTFTLGSFQSVLADTSLLKVYANSLKTALFTAAAGTIIVYGAALATARSSLGSRAKSVLEGISLITNTIPGMVLGIAFLLAFKGTIIQNTLFILVICNIIHYFSTPYLMLKNSLSKMNTSWEQTARLMGDTWMKTVLRVVTPNTFSALLEVFCYYFVNAMVTVSAVIFLAGSRTMIITAKIKELQHFAKFNEIFVLSLFILATNLLAKGVFSVIAKKH